MVSSLQSPPESPRLTSSPPDAAFWALTRPGIARPDELPAPVSVASDRFPHRIERLDPAKRGADGLTDVSRLALELLERLNPEAERDDLVEFALLLEVSAADLDRFRAAVKSPGLLPTDHGDLVVLEYPALAMTLARDPDNPRSVLRLGVASNSGGYSYTPPVLAERDTSGFRTLEFKDAAHYRELHEAQRQALGFGGSVRNRRDRLDLERIGLVGVQKPATVAPTKLLDRSTGRAGTQLVLVDANRRYTAQQRLFEAALPLLGFGELSRRHLFDGESIVFRRFNADDAQLFREELAEAFSGIDAPGPSGDDVHDRSALRRWARAIDDNRPDHAVLLRTRVIPARVVVGVDAASARAATDPVTTAIGAYRDQLHLPDLTDVEWSGKATQTMVGQDLLRRSKNVGFGWASRLSEGWQDALLFAPTEVSWSVPGLRSTHDPKAAATVVDDVVQSGEGIAALAGNLPPAVAGPGAAGDRPLNVLDLVLATTATLVCRAQPFTPVIADVLARHRMPNSPKERGETAASILLPLLGMPADGTDSARLFSALSRTLDHGAIYKLDEAWDPLGEDLRWVDLIGRDWFEIVDRARKEAAASRSVSAAGERRFGPAQTILSLAAAVALEASPVLRTSDQSDNPYQLTLSGLGGRHGAQKAEPYAVLLPLAITDDGITQLWEAVVAAIAGPARLPRSVRWDENATNGRRYTPYLTEYDLRNGTWGGRSTDDGAGGARKERDGERLSASAFVAKVFQRAVEAVEESAAEVAPVVDHDRRGVADPALDAAMDGFMGSPAAAYFAEGVDREVADRIVAAAGLLQLAAIQGKSLRLTAAGGSVL